MFTRLLRLVSYIAVINAPNPPVWSLWGCVMKMLSILRKFARSRARRRVTPSPASMIYWLPLTTSRFDDCARPASGNGPFFVPNVMTRVPFLDDAPSLFDCPQAKGDTADAAALAARCRNCLRWRSFIVTSLRSFAICSRILWNVEARVFGLGELQRANSQAAVPPRPPGSIQLEAREPDNHGSDGNGEGADQWD